MTHDHDTPGGANAPGSSSGADEGTAHAGGLDHSTGDDGDRSPDQLTLFALLEQVDLLDSAPTRHADARLGAQHEATGQTEWTANHQEGRADILPGLLAALAAAKAQGGQRLADDLLLGATDARHEALMDALLAPTGEQPAEAPDEQRGLPYRRSSSADIAPAAPAGLDQRPTTRLSSGAQRALAHIFGAPPTGDSSFYAQRPTPPARRVAESRETYQIDGEPSTLKPDEEQ